MTNTLPLSGEFNYLCYSVYKATLLVIFLPTTSTQESKENDKREREIIK